jgi:hypothetical protein
VTLLSISYMAGDEGFEPPISGPEPGALPLGQSPSACDSEDYSKNCPERTESEVIFGRNPSPVVRRAEILRHA